MKRTWRDFGELFVVFAKIGLFTFGGGYAMISMIEQECVDKKSWASADDIANAAILAESTPGPISINCATYVGYHHAGVAGAAVATFGLILPSFLIIFAVSLFLEEALGLELVAHAFAGIKIAAGVLVISAAVSMIRKMKKRTFSLAIMACACVFMLASSMLSLRIPSVALLLIAAFAGVVAHATTTARNTRREDLE